MVSVLLDTNILVDYLNGVEQAKAELERYADKAISSITWFEVMAGATPESEIGLKGFLSAFVILPVDENVMAAVLAIRKKYSVKLPDAIILASAQVNKRMLVTLNSEGFMRDEPDVRIPYWG